MRRRIGAVILGLAVIATYFSLDRGLPAYQLHAATSAVTNAGGKISTADNGELRVDFSGTGLDDAALKRLADSLSSLHVTDLSLAGTSVSDDGLDALSNLTSLKRIDVSQTRVTRAGTRGLGRALPDVDITQ
jgi:hypothetical protein